ncbi:MAG: endonuclease/exonuclease/phosphatase family protein [Thiohalorhabdaceae bacterium]
MPPAPVTRDFGRFAQHTNSLLSRIPIQAVHEHRLPGAMDGRGTLEARFNLDGRPLTVFVTHLALSQRTRKRQTAYLAHLVQKAGPSVVMGDFNAKPGSPEITQLRDEAGLAMSNRPAHATLPSWRPRAAVDHILATPELTGLRDRRRSPNPIRNRGPHLLTGPAAAPPFIL